MIPARLWPVLRKHGAQDTTMLGLSKVFPKHTNSTPRGSGRPRRRASLWAPHGLQMRPRAARTVAGQEPPIAGAIDMTTGCWAQ